MKRNALLIVLLLSLALSSCATPQPPLVRPLEVSPAQLPEVPADVMVERVANFRERLLRFFSGSPTKLTP